MNFRFINVITVPTTLDQAMTWAVRFWLALKQQDYRIRPEQPTLALAGTSELDAMIFADLCDKFRLCAKVVAKMGDRSARSLADKAIEVFDQEAPDVQNLRDIFAHIDAYMAGTGNLQKGHTNPCLVMYYSRGEDYTIHISLADGLHLQLPVGQTLDAVERLFRVLDKAHDLAVVPQTRPLPD